MAAITALEFAKPQVALGEKPAWQLPVGCPYDANGTVAIVAPKGQAKFATKLSSVIEHVSGGGAASEKLDSSAPTHRRSACEAFASCDCCSASVAAPRRCQRRESCARFSRCGFCIIHDVTSPLLPPSFMYGTLRVPPWPSVGVE